ncbi:MAG: CopD family protein [Limisphaerales bacterium]
MHFGACLLFFGVFFFDRFAASVVNRPGISGFWQARLRVISLALLPLILVSGIAWFAIVAVTMSGQRLDAAILKIVWTQTQFGNVWKIRLLFLVVSIVLSTFQRASSSTREFAAWVETLAAGCLVASLAWAGHGQETSPWHLFADILHLLAAGIWPAGLLPLFLILRTALKVAEPENWPSISRMVSRFSAISLATVTLLALTGVANSWYLVGSFSNLVGKPYGQWLLAKIILFCVAVTIAVVNLLWLKPRLAAARLQPARAAATARQLQINAQFELLLGSAIIAIVAVLGILPPAIE